MKGHLRRFIQEEDGQNLVEYALLAGLVALVATVALTNIGTEVSRLYTGIETKLKGIATP